MVNFMCHLDWATGCPDLWSNIILGVSVGVLHEMNILNGRVEQIARQNVGGPHLISRRLE